MIFFLASLLRFIDPLDSNLLPDIIPLQFLTIDAFKLILAFETVLAPNLLHVARGSFIAIKASWLHVVEYRVSLEDFRASWGGLVRKQRQ